jgi:LysR family transcriptional regulator, benzoate and cis,cis-muconate-responsive activator of ben and cat genes
MLQHHRRPYDVMIDVRHLQYFLAVAAERSFTKGAERLNMAQPPLSRRVQEMEAELGIRLFDRNAKPLALTSAGHLFYEESMQILQRVAQMRAAMARFVARERTRFVIGVAPSTLYARLPRVIRRFQELSPDVELSLSGMTTLNQIPALTEGRINVGFGRIRLNVPGIRQEVLREERLIVAVPLGHPLATGEDPVELSALAALPVIVYPGEPRPSYADQVLSFFRDQALEPQSVLEVQELQMAMVMVAAGAGTCVVPASVQRHGRSDLIFRPLATKVTSPIIMSHRIGDSSPQLLTLFRAFVELYTEWGWPVPKVLLNRLTWAGEDAPKFETVLDSLQSSQLRGSCEAFPCPERQ